MRGAVGHRRRLEHHPEIQHLSRPL
jgi:hypothetical protein